MVGLQTCNLDSITQTLTHDSIFLNQKASINSCQKIQVIPLIPNNTVHILWSQFLVDYSITLKCHKNYPFIQVSLKACLLLQCQVFLKLRQMTLSTSKLCERTAGTLSLISCSLKNSIKLWISDETTVMPNMPCCIHLLCWAFFLLIWWMLLKIFLRKKYYLSENH